MALIQCLGHHVRTRKFPPAVIVVAPFPPLDHSFRCCCCCRFWMYNEVWPCASWGSIEYGPPDQPGQLLGGRWRPLHYQLRSSIFADQLATCNTGGACFVTNSAPFAFKGEVIYTLPQLF